MRKNHLCVTCVCLLAVIAVIAAHLPRPAAAAGSSLWTYTPDQPIKWHRLTSLGTVLIGTDDAVLCLDPVTGKSIWKRAMTKVPEYAVEEIPGTPLVLIAEGAGNNKTKLYAIEIISGQSFWESDRLKGATIGILPVPEKNMVLLLTSPNAGSNKAKPDMIAFDTFSGDVKWESEFEDKVDLHTVEGRKPSFGNWGAKYDLSGHAQPVYDGDSAYFTYAGLHRYDLNTGKLVWGVKYDVTEGRIKRGNAPALVDGDVIYTSAKGQLRAHDKATGEIKWKSKDFAGAVAQMILKGDVIYCRMGGHFYDYGKKEFVQEKPYGVVAVSKRTGEVIWKFDKAQDGITNMALLPEQNSLLIADAKTLIGLDTTGEGKIKESFRVPLEFKFKIGGGAKAARAGMKFARGGLIGMAKKDHDEDAPVAIEPRENGTYVVRAKQHLLAFEPKSHQIPWSVEYDAPGVPNWEKLVMFAITAAAYSAEFNQEAHTQLGSAGNTQAHENKAAIMKMYQDFFFKRYSATRTTANYMYVLTNLEGGDKTPGLIGVNLNTGAPDYEVPINSKEPNYIVDETTGRLFILGKDGKELTAYTVK